jgi:hypothetical protein
MGDLDGQIIQSIATWAKQFFHIMGFGHQFRNFQDASAEKMTSGHCRDV